MPFVLHTPESLVQRSDSKNPATTCKGITTEGRYCRRDIASNKFSPVSRRTSKLGVLAVLPAGGSDQDGAAAYFCWQHKNQAEHLTSGSRNDRQASIVPLQNRTSIDTIAERLGIVDLEEVDSNRRHSKQKRQHARSARKETLPRNWQDVEGPLLALPEGRRRPSGRKSTQRPLTAKKGESNLALSLFCCIRSVDTDLLPPPRRSEYSEKQTNSTMPLGAKQAKLPTNNSPPQKLPQSMSPRSAASTICNHSSGPERPVLGRKSTSQTQNLLSLMPAALSPQITSLLLAELAKPISPLDEAGYIYMFWLTDTAEVPDEDTASSLLGDTGQSSPAARGQSDVLKRFASVKNARAGKASVSTVLLKIGRAANIQRRMNQWTRQCGYNLSLIRYYPYQPYSSSKCIAAPASPLSPQKVPHAHKVERLIHLELAEKRIKRDCESCGKEHREWFEVESNRSGLRDVDEVVRRWVTWGQRNGGK